MGSPCREDGNAHNGGGLERLADPMVIERTDRNGCRFHVVGRRRAEGEQVKDVDPAKALAAGERYAAPDRRAIILRIRRRRVEHDDRQPGRPVRPLAGKPITEGAAGGQMRGALHRWRGHAATIPTKDSAAAFVVR